MHAPEEPREQPATSAPSPAAPAGPAAPAAGGSSRGRIILYGLGAVAAAVLLLAAFVMMVPKVALEAYANWQELTGTAPRGGLLFIEAPQVYTRERLVNDRFDQANWLTHELEVSSQDGATQRLQAAAQALDLRSRIDLRLTSGGAPRAETPPQTEPKPAAEDPLQLEAMALLDRRLEYRNKVRSELMDTQLDDSHDLDGNTLYRFNFDTVVMPWADVRRYPGTAVFLITAESTRREGTMPEAEAGKAGPPEPNSEPVIEARDDLELLQSWRREIQSFLTKVVKFRIENFYQEQTENKTNPKEDIQFEFFLRRTLMNAFIDMLSANIVAYCREDRTCPHIWLTRRKPTPTDRQLEDDALHERRKLLSRLLGVEYDSSYSTNLSYPPAMEIGFRNALAVAHKINTLQWPRLSGKSYRHNCLKDLADETASAEVIERKCLLPYSDKGSKRAMIRLILVLEAMKKRMEASDHPLFEVGALDFSTDRPPDWFSTMRATFAGIVPDPRDIEDLSREMGEVRTDTRSLSLLDQIEATCEAGPYRFDPKKLTKEELVAYGRCRFLKAHVGRIENIVARFIHQRIDDGQPKVGEMALTNFVDVDKVGCDVTECRIEVRTKEREDLLCESGGQARSCDAARTPGMDNTHEDLRRTLKVCYQIINNRLSPTHAVASAKRAPYRFIGLDQPFFLTDAEKDIFYDCVTASELRDWLEEANANIAVYEISPHTSGNVVKRTVSSATSGAAGLDRGVLAGGISGSSEARDNEIGVTRVVIGFGQLGPNPGGVTRQASFGWVVRPQESVDGRWMPSHHRLSAIISVPSWWKRLKFSIQACWATPEMARAVGFGMVNDPQRICQAGEEEQRVPGDGPAAAGGGRMTRTFIAQLPRRTEDVTERFRFDFIKAPFLDDQWLASNPQLRLEAGRSGKLVVLGGRLWRGTVATVMGRPANKITVLPDMKGVIAEFDCVATPAEMAPVAGGPATAPPESMPATDRKPKVQMLTVWTSEGRTQDWPVEIYPFNPAFGGRPCDAPPLPQAATAPTPATPAAEIPKTTQAAR